MALQRDSYGAHGRGTLMTLHRDSYDAHGRGTLMTLQRELIDTLGGLAWHAGVGGGATRDMGMLRGAADGRDRACAEDAYQAVDLPDSVLDLLVNLRQYLQDKCEPPVYVSDRRFMKAVNLLQVAAHADGRDEVTPTITWAPNYNCHML